MIDPEKIFRTLDIPQLFSDSDSGSSTDRNSFMSFKNDDKRFEKTFYKRNRVDCNSMHIDLHHQGPH